MVGGCPVDSRIPEPNSAGADEEVATSGGVVDQAIGSMEQACWACPIPSHFFFLVMIVTLITATLPGNDPCQALTLLHWGSCRTL